MTRELTDQEYAARLRAGRGYAGLTLEQLGREHFGISRQALARRESGEMPISPAERLYMATKLVELTRLPMGFFTEPDLESVFGRPERSQERHDSDPDDLGPTPREIVNGLEIAQPDAAELA